LRGSFQQFRYVFAVYQTYVATLGIRRFAGLCLAVSFCERPRLTCSDSPNVLVVIVMPMLKESIIDVCKSQTGSTGSCGIEL
jgi:hypothetical protein